MIFLKLSLIIDIHLLVTKIKQGLTWILRILPLSKQNTPNGDVVKLSATVDNETINIGQPNGDNSQTGTSQKTKRVIITLGQDRICHRRSAFCWPPLFV